MFLLNPIGAHGQLGFGCVFQAEEQNIKNSYGSKKATK